MEETTNQPKSEPHCPTDKAYTDIINSDTDVDKTFIEELGKPAKIVYYCRECKKTVAPKRIGKKLSFKCSECNKEPIPFGTENSITNYFNVK